MNVLIILGHPREDSLSYALGEAYAEGARQEGACVRRLPLAQMHFNPDVEAVSPRDQTFEEDIRQSRQLIQWADHLVFVYPTWWGTVPALLKGFLDRVLTSGFAFNEIEGGTGYEGLLKGKSARLITTMDTPRWVYRWLYWKPGHNAMRKATLQFCGIRPVRVSAFGPVKESDSAERQEWIDEVRRAGRRRAKGTLVRRDWLHRKVRAWLKALRLQFYPMTFVAYTIGALAAARPDGAFAGGTYALGYLWLFCAEAATVLSNDYFDYRSDRQNEYFSPFTGGSRVLVEGELSFRELRAGIGGALAVVLLAGALLVAGAAVPLAVAAVLFAVLVLALGYTVPPLKLSHRGLGELDVGLTHSFGAVLCGYVVQGGAPGEALPWLLSVPLFLGVLPAILLAGVPDYEADRAASKTTLVVMLGRKASLWLAMGLVLLSAAVGVLWESFGIAGGAFQGLSLFVLPHAALLLVMLYRQVCRESLPERIDRLLAVALAYILWFGLVPLFHLL